MEGGGGGEVAHSSCRVSGFQSPETRQHVAGESLGEDPERTGVGTLSLLPA